VSFVDTGYGYRLSQNLTSKTSQVSQGGTSQKLVSAEKVLITRGQAPKTLPVDLSKARGDTSNATTPKYKPLTYHPSTVRSTKPMQSTANKQLFQKEAVSYEPAFKKSPILVPSPVSSRDYLSFFMLKANHLKN